MKLWQYILLAVWVLGIWLPQARVQVTPANNRLELAIVLPLSGEQAGIGEVQRETLEQYFRSITHIGQNRLELSFYDDASDPQKTVQIAQKIVAEDGAHMLICCSTSAAARAVHAALVDAVHPAPVLMLAPFMDEQAGQNIHGNNQNWHFSIPPTPQTWLRRMLLEMSDHNIQTLAFMGPVGTVGDVATKAFADMIFPGSITVLAQERYQRNADAVTPEALLLATLQPNMVMVWDDVNGSFRAVDALRRRGYEGIIYVQPEVLLDVANRGRLEHTRSVLNNVQANHWQHGAAQEFRIRTGSQAVEAAYAWDAALLAYNALQMQNKHMSSLYIKQISAPTTTDMRQQLRDSLIVMPPLAGVTATFDFVEHETNGIDPYSLLMVNVRDGKLELNTVPDITVGGIGGIR